MAELESPTTSVDSLRRAAMDPRLLAKHNPDKRIRIASSGALRPLIALLRSATPSPPAKQERQQQCGANAVLDMLAAKKLLPPRGILLQSVHALPLPVVQNLLALEMAYGTLKKRKEECSALDPSSALLLAAAYTYHFVLHSC